MVIARLKGGLGNQLFILAAARSFALKLNTDIQLDTRSGFWNDKYRRSYELGFLDLNLIKVSWADSLRIKMQDKFKINLGVTICNEEVKGNINIKSQTIVLNGYFQSEVYFSDQKSFLKSKIENLDVKELNINLRIPNGYTPICLHGRLLRAYSSNDKLVSSEHDKVLPYSYFNTAIKQITTTVPKPYFIIFSDNPKVFIKHLELPAKSYTLIEHPYQKKPSIDFLLMMQCKHFIISNSSYSWWPAWLSETSETIIIAPNEMHWDNPDTVPSRWHKIEVLEV
jgi:hypothetical protein